MSVNFASDVGKNGNRNIPSREDVNYEDDGFFSDVPGSGSLSRSLLALNKYVKKNLLYDETEEYESDSAYYSKETSPNKSRTKYDSDSLKSNDSVEDKSVARKSTASITYGTATITQLTDDDKSMQLQNKSYNDSDNDTVSDNADTQSVTISEIVSEPTDIQNEPKHQPEYNSASMHNLTNIIEPDIEINIGEQVKYRQNPTNLKKDNRHTLHEFSDWGNRTDIYPDVYAPLPYSEYTNSFRNCRFFCAFHFSIGLQIIPLCFRG